MGVYENLGHDLVLLLASPLPFYFGYAYTNLVYPERSGLIIIEGVSYLRFDNRNASPA
jgi:hypothetical protein